MVSHTKTRSKLARAVAGICRMEPLEDRQLLTTLNGGDVFLYKDSKTDIFRITVLGNTQAEFVGAAVDATNNVTLGDLAPFDATTGVDLFAIYVAQADWNSVITIEKVTVDTNSGRITPNPFNGNITLNVTNARDGQPLSINSDGNTGSAYLGARTVQVNGQNNSDNHAILSANLPGQIGVLPTDTGPWSAGLVVADGQDLGKFLFDGTITGNVDVHGSMNLFYAGQILTGDANGEFISSFPAAFPTNFNIDGDLRDLVVSGSVGTDNAGNSGPGDDPTYLTRFQMRVGGHLGQVHTAGAFYGTVEANDQDKYFHNEVQTEIESRGTFTTFADGFLNDTLGNGDDQFQNDNFNTAQYLGTLQDGIVVDGELDALARANFNDFTDYYGVALMAGQTVTVQLTDTTFLGFPGGGPTGFPNFVNIGVYDPDGRLIATDYSDVNRLALLGKPFQFTADRPGVYRFAVAEAEDADFNGPGGEFSRPGHIGIETYELSINGAGNMAVGAVSAGTNLMDPELATDGFVAHNGDFGAILAGGSTIFQFKTGNLLSTDPVDVFSIRTDNGNLRTVEANDVGRLFNGAPIEGPGLSIKNGDVGLLRSRTGVLSINESLLGSDLPGTTGTTSFFPTPDVPRNYQVVDAATRFLGVLLADQKIGIIRAGDMATLDPSIFHVNDDNFGADGVIDLIDVAGDFGTLRGGGPHITAGPKGDVRYIDVGGILYRDEAFGGGRPDLTHFDAGQTATITDDSGAILRISPGSTSSLGILTYGIRGSGGSAIVRIETTASVNIKSNTRKNTSPAEIGHIFTNGIGPNIVRTPTGTIILDPAYAGTGVNVNINGKARVDVYKIEGAKFNTIANATPGELVTVMGESAGILSAQDVGMPMHSTPAAIVGRTTLVRGVTYPYIDQTTGILLADLIQAKSYGQIGNLIISQPMVAAAIGNGLFDPRLIVPPLIDVVDNFGSIERLSADTNNKQLGTDFEGITGPIMAQQPLINPPIPNSGHIIDVSIGAGILPSGNGNLAKAGIFANGRIGIVRGKKTADIRGNIVSGDSIGRIDLANGGSIINADILVVLRDPLIGPIQGTEDQAREFVRGRATPTDTDSVETPVFDIGLITLTGDAKGKVNPRRPKPQFRGGIIGSFISAPDIGPTILKGGSFGIINSIYSVPGDGVMAKFQTDGYGLRNDIILAGATIGDMIAQGNGTSLNSRVFTDDVRQSETQSIDPFFQFAPNALTDLHKFLGTSKNTPTLAGITDTGIIAGVSAQASRDLNSLVAWKVVGNSESEPATFNFANHIKKIQIAQDLFNVDIITGQLDKFTVGHDVINLNMTVAGPIGTISIGHDYDVRSRVHAIGPDGSIDSIFVGHDLDGDMAAENTVGKLKVNGLYNGDVTADGVRVQKS